MDLSVFSKYQEYQSETGRQFNPALRANNHEDPDIHLIGESVPSASVISTIGDAATVGTSPVPAREDHSHGYTEYSLPLATTTPTVCSTSSGAVGTSTSVARADHRHQYTDTVYTHPSSITLTSLTTTSNVTLSNGSNVAPALRFSSDTQMGLYKTGSTMVFTDGGAAKLEIGGSIRTIDRDFEVTGSLYGFRTDRIRMYYNNITTTSSAALNISAPSNYINLNSWTKYVGPPAGAYFNVTWNATNSIMYINTSKRELKERIKSVPADFAGDVVDKLNPVSFIYRKKYKGTRESETWRKADIQYGFIAEEVAEANEKIALWDLDRDKEGNSLENGKLVPAGYSEPGLIAIAIAEIKSLRKRVSELEDKLHGKALLDAK